MANVAIQNIKILHKRYTNTEWINGTTNGGAQLRLDKGELGFDLTNLVLKIGTADGQHWSQAHEVCAATLVHKYKVGGEYTEVVPTDTTNYFVSKVEEVSGASGTKLVYYYDEVIIPDAPALTFVDDTTTKAAKGGVVVVANIAQDGSDNHKLTETKVEVATPDQVDSKVKVVSDRLDAHSISVTKNGNGQFITGVKTVTTSNDKHEVVLESGDLIIDMPDASGSVTASGTNGKTISYVKAVSLGEDESGNHVLSGETDTITLPTGRGSVGAHNDASTTIATRVVLNDSTLEGDSKDIVSATGSKVSVTGTSNQIQIGVDLSDYATKNDVAAAVNGATHYAGTVAPGSTKGGAFNLTTLGDLTNGAFYMAVNDGYVIDSTNGVHDETHTNGVKTAIQLKKGDSILLHKTSNDTHWDIITSGDDVEYRPIKVNNTEILGLDNSSAVDFISGDAIVVSTNAGSNGEQQVKVSHADTSSVSNVTKVSRQYIDGIEFDNYGHVTAITVGSEVDQNASGGETARNLSVISKAVLSKDANGDIKLETATKSFEGDDYISVTENSNAISVDHKTITQVDTTSNASPKHTESFTVIDSVSRDGAGHITGVNTKTVTLPEVPEYIDTNDNIDTTYDISLANGSVTAGKTNVELSLNSTKNDLINNTTTSNGADKVTIEALSDVATPADGFQVQVSGDKVTFTGKATKDLLGLIKAFASLTSDQASTIGEAIKSYTGANNDRLYGVNVLPNGKAFVEVPDTHKTVDAHGVDLYAFSNDNQGHVTSAVAITTIDGNLN